MNEKKLFNEVSFALEQIAHERKVIKAYASDPTNENVGSVTLEVSGVEHVILIHDEDVVEFANLLLKYNKKEHARMVGGGKPRFHLGRLLKVAALW